MAMDPTELLSPRDRLAYNINMRGAAGVAADAPPSPNMPPRETAFFGEDGLDFEDFIDIVNPLQHLPLVSIAYRAMTGDELSTGARVIGGGLYGGPAGAIFGAINAAVVEASGGNDLGALALNAVTGDDEPSQTAASGEIEQAAAEVGAIEPAAGDISAPEATAWVDPDTLPPSAIEPEPTAAAQAAPVALVPETLNIQPSSAAAGSDTIPELSEDQVALLLSSVGLGGQHGSSQTRQALTAVAPPPANDLDATEPLRQTQRPAVKRGTMGPMKQIYVRPPIGAKAEPHAPVTQEMRSHMTPASASGSGDQAWIANAMAQALDKYRGGDALKPGAQNQGAIVDGSY